MKSDRLLGKTIQSMHPEHAHGKIDWLLAQAAEEKSSDYASMLISVPDTILQLRVVGMYDAEGLAGYNLILYDITGVAAEPAESAAAAEPSPAAASEGTVRCLAKLPVSTQGRIALLDIGQAAYLRADGHYTQIFADGKHHFCNLSLSQLEPRLPEDKFVRVHRSYIVNLDFAKAVERRDDHFVIVIAIAGAGAGDQRVPVSRGNLARLRQLLGV